MDRVTDRDPARVVGGHLFFAQLPDGRFLYGIGMQDRSELFVVGPDGARERFRWPG